VLDAVRTKNRLKPTVIIPIIKYFLFKKVRPLNIIKKKIKNTKTENDETALVPAKNITAIQTFVKLLKLAFLT
jgi:hypothetical protein